MPITRADIFAPRGEIELEFYPGENTVEDAGVDPRRVVDIRIDTYIAEGYAKAGAATNADAIANAWAHHRAYDAAYNIKLSRPAGENLGPMGLPARNFIRDQILGMKGKAEEYLETFEEQLAIGVAPTYSTTTGYYGQSTVNRFEW